MSNKSKTPEQLEAELTQLRAENSALASQTSELQTMVTDLNAEVRALNATKGNKVPFTTLPDGNTKVQVRSGARVDGVAYTAAELAARPDLCAKLMAKKSEVVQLINA